MRLLELAAGRNGLGILLACWLLAMLLPLFLPVSPDDTAAHDALFLALTLGLAAALASWVGARLAYLTQLRHRLGDFEIRVAEGREIPIGLLPIDGELQELGLQACGAVAQRLPWQPWNYAWVYADGSIVAALGLSRTTTLRTTWPDGSLITTSAPGPRTAEHRAHEMWALVVAGDLAARLARHRAAVSEFGSDRCAPLSIGSIEDAVDAYRRSLPTAAAFDAVRLTAQQRSPSGIASIALPLLLALGLVVVALMTLTSRP